MLVSAAAISDERPNHRRKQTCSGHDIGPLACAVRRRQACRGRVAIGCGRGLSFSRRGRFPVSGSERSDALDRGSCAR